MARLYLFPDATAADGRRIVRWVLQEFIAAAQRHQHFSKARALRIDPALLSPTPAGPDVPEMPDWAADNFLSDEAEWYQIQRYEEYLKEALPARKKAEARDESKARIRKAQLNAIITLEDYVREYPSPADPLICWFDERDIDTFENAGIFTVGDLVRTIKSEGRRWWARVDRIGAEAAQRVAIWLKANASTINIDPDHIDRDKYAIVAAAREATTVSFTIRPLEYLLWPEEFVGHSLSADCTLAARNDWEAFQTWLNNTRNANTRRAYQIQVERFWLWCMFEKGIPISQAKTEHCINYLDFLEDISTVGSSEWDEEGRWKNKRDAWVGGNRAAKRHTSEWRPFVGKFGGRSRAQAYTIVKGFFAFLAKKNYIVKSPWEDVNEPKSAASKLLKVKHSLSEEHVVAVIAHCDTIKDELSRTRMKLALVLALRTGMRRFELTSTKLGHFVYEPPIGKKRGYYKLAVLGKGHKLGFIPLADDIFEYVEAYLAARGIERAADGKWNPVIPLFASVRRNEAPRTVVETTPIYEQNELDASDNEDEIYQKVSVRSRKRRDSPGVMPRTHGGIDYDRILRDFESQVLHEYQSDDWLEALSLRVPNGISEQSFYEMLKAHFASTAAAVEHIDLADKGRLAQASTHWLRHTFGTLAVRSGTKLTVVQDRMRHSNINTTAQYIETDDSEQLEVDQLLKGKLSGKS